MLLSFVQIRLNNLELNKNINKIFVSTPIYKGYCLETHFI